ncbi:MAG: hypothetical protein ACKOYL_06830, partial [Actinomycetota bacterium]
GRINKRTCHITVVVGVMDDRRLSVFQAKSATRGVTPATAARRARVERSRQRAAAAKDEAAPAANESTEAETTATADTNGEEN